MCSTTHCGQGEQSPASVAPKVFTCANNAAEIYQHDENCVDDIFSALYAYNQVHYVI